MNTDDDIELEEELTAQIFPGCISGGYGCCEDGATPALGPNQEGCPVYKSACEYPVVSGNCKKRYVRYYYEHVSQRCRSFIYSGCGGNPNSFKSNFQCIKACEKSSQRSKYITFLCKEAIECIIIFFNPNLYLYFFSQLAIVNFVETLSSLAKFFKLVGYQS